MKTSFYIQLETPPKGVNHATNFEGKTAARNWDKLTAAAKNIGIKPLQEFVSIRKQDLAALSAKKSALAGAIAIRKDLWFSPREGLLCLRKLISYISNDKTAFEGARALIRDLQSYENILSAADARGSKFHFSPDIQEDEVEEPAAG